MNDLITKEQVSESDMRAISQMFARAANAVVDASELGKVVKTLQGEVEKLVSDTQRLREHIQWLEQENVTLRGQRDEAQNALSDARQTIDQRNDEIQHLVGVKSTLLSERDNARGEAKLWQEEATKLEQERNGLKAEVTYLKGMLTTVWDNIRDHFTEPQAPKAEAKPIDHQNEWSSKETVNAPNHNETEATIQRHSTITQSTDPNAPHYVHQPRDEYGRWVDPNQANSGDSGIPHI